MFGQCCCTRRSVSASPIKVQSNANSCVTRAAPPLATSGPFVSRASGMTTEPPGPTSNLPSQGTSTAARVSARANKVRTPRTPNSALSDSRNLSQTRKAACPSVSAESPPRRSAEIRRHARLRVCGFTFSALITRSCRLDREYPATSTAGNATAYRFPPGTNDSLAPRAPSVSGGK
jgi:hypothetical protein